MANGFQYTLSCALNKTLKFHTFVVGRKAWLFSDTPKGAHASGIFYSLIETAKANGIEPYTYLRYIFKELPYADTVEKIEALMPWHVKGKIGF